MRRFLIVGCGGSGGATLAYLMDQLRSDLARHGVSRLPQGWQFVHLDVPNTSEPPANGLGSVEQQGGVYFGCGPQAGGYAVLDSAVSQRFAETQRLDLIGTWAPRAPEKVTNPIQAGAGQYRAVGRMITLSRATALRETLQRAWNRLNLADTRSEATNLRVPGLGEYDDGAPVVLVVSSMAGGAGASMALDVCRLLALVSGLNPQLMGVFMVAANAFDTLPEAARTGVRPNALAMLGEIVASQTGSSREHDRATMSALGLPGGEAWDVPFARVFPVGRFAGVDRTQFGDGTPQAIYRGLGRGLAGLIMSETATGQFVSFDLGNNASPNGDRSLLGWGSDWAPLPWGSYGFASLSMGRDRYAEYAAQRLAASCVDRLLRGHLQPDNPASSNEQVDALLDNQWPGAVRRIGLPLQEADLGAWMTESAFPREEVETAARAVVEKELRPHIPNPGGTQANQWVPTVRHRLGARRAGLLSESEQAALNLAYRWHQQFLADIEQEVCASAARLGLPYTVALVDRLTLHLRELLAPEAGKLATLAPADLGSVPPEVEPAFARLRGVIQAGQQLVDRLLNGSRNLVRTQIYASTAELVRQLMLGATIDVLGPLSRALSEAQRVLENAAGNTVTDRGLARLATDQYAAWPSDADLRVPERFDEADNEILLTSSSDFDQQYVSDVRRSTDEENGSLNFPDARSLALASVIAGRWRTTGGIKAPEGLLDRLHEWRSRVFTVVPGTPDPVTPSRARYDLHVRPAELLARARAFVARPGESFDQFCRLSIRDFVLGDGVPETELDRRRRELVGKFTETLALARPLISVDSTALQAVHRGTNVEYRYKFSEVPFAGLPVADELRRVLNANTMIDQPSVSNLNSAIGDSGGVTRIDVFGSYPNYSPLVFDAVLGPVASQWAETSAIGRESFWQWRRSRPLDAALPMGTDERRAMVAGWLLGQILGRIRIPEPPYTRPVQIWDSEDARWLAFPHPMLTPPSRFEAEYDWLPAVLESVLIAVAKSHLAPVMSSLRPYQLLRAIYDDSSQGPVGGIDVLSARRLIGDWLVTGETPPGATAEVVPGAAELTVDERIKPARAWLERIRNLASVHYLPAGQDGAEGGGTFSVIARRAVASRTPMFHDVAGDVHWATGHLMGLLAAARDTAVARSTQASRSNGRPIVEERISVPEGGTF